MKVLKRYISAKFLTNGIQQIGLFAPMQIKMT